MKLELFNIWTNCPEGAWTGNAGFRFVLNEGDYHSAQPVELQLELYSGAIYKRVLGRPKDVANLKINFQIEQDKPNSAMESHFRNIRSRDRSIEFDIVAGVTDYCYLKVANPNFPVGTPLFGVGNFSLGWGREDVFTCNLLEQTCSCSSKK